MAASGALTAVERRAVEESPFAEIYPPTEKIKTIAVENFPALGKLAAMRFVEWVQDHRPKRSTDPRSAHIGRVQAALRRRIPNFSPGCDRLGHNARKRGWRGRAGATLQGGTAGVS